MKGKLTKIMGKLLRRLKKTLKFVFSRKIVIALLIIAQLVILVSSFFWLAEIYRVVYWIFTGLGLVLVCYILNTAAACACAYGNAVYFL